MKWSKLKKIIESRFAPAVLGKVKLYSTQYGCQCGRGWITYEGEQIANFETILHLNRIHRDHELKNEHGHVLIQASERIPGETIARGEFSRWNLHEACWEFMNMNIDDALQSTNPIIQGLAFLDARFGKRRALAFESDPLHPLAKKLLEIRRHEDKVPIEAA